MNRAHLIRQETFVVLVEPCVGGLFIHSGLIAAETMFDPHQNSHYAESSDLKSI